MQQYQFISVCTHLFIIYIFHISPHQFQLYDNVWVTWIKCLLGQSWYSYSTLQAILQRTNPLEKELSFQYIRKWNNKNNNFVIIIITSPLYWHHLHYWSPYFFSDHSTAIWTVGLSLNMQYASGVSLKRAFKMLIAKFENCIFKEQSNPISSYWKDCLQMSKLFIQMPLFSHQFGCVATEN